MSEEPEDVSGWVEVDDARKKWVIRNHHPWRINLKINRPSGPQRRSEYFGEIAPFFDVDILARCGVTLTSLEPFEGDWVAEAIRIEEPGAACA